jgi:hypothetical protein
VLNCAGEALNPGCCTGRSGGIELDLGGVESCLGPFRTLAVGVGKDWIESAVGPIGAAPGSGLLLTFGFSMITVPSSVAVMLDLLGRSGLGRES